MTAYQTAWKLRTDAKRRSQKGRDVWPCLQCGAAIVYNSNGGNTRKICTTCAPDNRFRTLVRRYGVDKQMFDAMYFEQGGECALAPCHREAVVVDHDHVTGKVRGLLCQGCNVAIGFIESSSWLNSALDYLWVAK